MPNRDVKDFPVSSPDFIDVRNGMTAVFEDFAGIESATRSRILPREDGTSEEVRFSSVTPNLLRLLGAQIALGRNFEEADGQPESALATGGSISPTAIPRSATAAILSYRYWRRRYAGDRSILGHAMPGGEIVVGVLAPGFELLLPSRMNLAREPDYWISSRLSYDDSQRIAGHLRMIGKLKDGVKLGQAQAAANLVAAPMVAEFPIKKAAGYTIRLERMQETLVEEARPALLLLVGAVFLLLLIACANVANLLLVRTSMRERELAMRAALGGSLPRLLRQMVAEALLLSGIGTILGVVLAWVGIHHFILLVPNIPELTNLPQFESVGINFPVLAFAVAIGLSAAVVFGVIPALSAAQPNVIRMVRASGRTPGLGRTARLRSMAVVTEVALSFLLLVAAGLMFRSFVALQQTNLGYDAQNLLTFRLNGGRGGPEQRAEILRQLSNRLSALVNVRGVAATTSLPLIGGTEAKRWGRQDDDPSTIAGAADCQFVTPGYFETLRTPLLAGRTFTHNDTLSSAKFVIVDQVFANKVFASESAIGKRILIGAGARPELFEIIGVVGHQRYSSLALAGREQLYLPLGLLQENGVGSYWAVRTSDDSSQYVAAIRAEVAKLDRSLLVSEVEPMETLVARAEAKTRFSLLLLAIFAIVAALLAAVGIYGVLSTLVRQRTVELAVRMALGASPSSILSLITFYGVRLSAVGVVIGLVVALVLSRAMASLLVGVQATDPATLIATAALVLILAALASSLPAHRAAGLSPLAALRED